MHFPLFSPIHGPFCLDRLLRHVHINTTDTPQTLSISAPCRPHRTVGRKVVLVFVQKLLYLQVPQKLLHLQVPQCIVKASRQTQPPWCLLLTTMLIATMRCAHSVVRPLTRPSGFTPQQFCLHISASTILPSGSASNNSSLQTASGGHCCITARP